MGLVSLPIILFLYWLVFHYKKNEPFPKWGVLSLLLAGAASAFLASVTYTPVSSVASAIYGAGKEETFLWNLLNMFMTAGLVEEALKFLTCRIAINRKGMIRTWMDCVIAFATVGITFQLIENISYGMRGGLAAAIARAIAPGHFVFGVIMGYFYGKYRVSGQKKYLWLCYVIPVIFHTFVDVFLQSVSLGKVYYYLAIATAIVFVISAVVTVCKVIGWQKKGSLDIPVIAAGQGLSIDDGGEG